MAASQSIPRVALLPSQLSQTTAVQIKAILPADILLKAHAAIPSGLTKTARQQNRIKKHKRPVNNRRGASTKQFTYPTVAAAAAASARNGADRIAKPCNSFLCYRSYYKQLFDGIPQAEASSHIIVLWSRDPFKAKWTMIAKAYSMLRDTFGKKNTSLSVFLKLIGPAIGLLDPEHYLQAMHWIISWNGQQNVLIQDPIPDISTFPAHFLITKMSERDIVVFCIERGYITKQTKNSSLLETAIQKYDESEQEGQHMQFTVLNWQAFTTSVATKNPVTLDVYARGIDEDNTFLEVSSALPKSLMLDDGTNFLIIEDEFTTTPHECEWGGMMSGLFAAEKAPLPLDLGDFLENEPEAIIDISDPEQLDNALIEAGANEQLFIGGREELLPEMLNFWDS